MTCLYNGIPADGRSASDPFVFRYENGVISAYIKRVYCAAGCDAFVYSDEDGTETTLDCGYGGLSRDCDVFTVSFEPQPGLYYVTFRIVTDGDVYYVHSTGDEINGELRDDIGKCGRFQILCTSAPKEVDRSFDNANMYHIFVDRFYCSGKSEKRTDAVYNCDWYNGIPEYTEYPGESFPNNTFFGGDLYGIAEKLGYLRDLGIDIIYLSPIFEAFSNHKYDTGNYEVIDRCFGGEAAFSELCEKAHRLGMKIVLDGVFNHTGADSVYFNKYKKYGPGGAYNDVGSPYYSWYNFINYPDEYECWWGVTSLPKLSQSEPAILEYFTGENGIIRKYLRLGADGWRLDVADELSDTLLDGIRDAANREKPGSIVIGEVWEDASNKISYGRRRHYFSRAQLDSVMDYPLKNAVIDYVKTGDTAPFLKTFTDVYRHYPKYVTDRLMNFLGTHDTERIMTVLGGDPADGRPGSVLVSMRMDERQYQTAKSRFFVAFSLLCFCPGIVSVYYGDEAGMQGYRDPFNRMPYPWGREDASIVFRVKELLHFRRSLHGPFEIGYSGDGLLVLDRSGYTYISNAGDEEKTVYFDGEYTDENGNVYDGQITVAPVSYVIIHKSKENCI
ncbi:MAG: glycoside hydrolase family 13 protein [Clostridia bacterium]|nr:glycoside hydrolase family 13 protein [Clostridia bacterium]